MWKGRTLVWCVAAFLAGDYFGGIVTLPPFVFLAGSAILATVSLISVKRYRFSHNGSTMFCSAALLTALFLCGSSAVQIGRIPSGEQSSRLEALAAMQKERFSQYIESIAPEEASLESIAVLKALSIGDRTLLSRELKASYKESGAMHLLALSGLHVGIIYKLISWILAILGGGRAGRLARSLTTLSILWCYSLISGLSASIFRAVTMITIYEISTLLHTSKDGPTALAASALIITLLDPEAPSDVGFQLSFSAVVSIYTLYPRLRGMLRSRSRALTYLWNILAMSLSCQLFTGVLSYFYFGTFPRFFLLTTVFAIPTVGIIMYLAAFSIAGSFISDGNWLTELLFHLLDLLNSIITSISELSME